MVKLSLGTLADTQADASRFCALSNSLYARPVDPDYYRWQFFHTPFPTRLFAARDEGGELAGCLAVQVRELVPHGRVGWVLDIMVDRRRQGAGVFRALEGFAREAMRGEVDLLAVMANDKANAATLKLGWQGLEVFVTAARPTTPAAALGHEFERLEEATSVAAVLDAWRDGVPGLEGRRLFANARTPALLDWRFRSNPRYAYERFRVTRGGVARGLLVLKTFRDPLTSRSFGDLVDAAWVEPDAQLLADMMQFALGTFAAQGVPEAAVWLQTNTLFDEVGRRCGFQSVPQRRFCLLRPLEGSAVPVQAADWFLSMADSEVY